MPTKTMVFQCRIFFNWQDLNLGNKTILLLREIKRGGNLWSKTEFLFLALI